MIDRTIAGCVVRHRGGGPQMCVEGEEDGRILCAWFVGYDLLRASFDPDELELVTRLRASSADA